MGIDGIGKPPVPPVPGAGAAKAPDAAPSAEGFSVGASAPSAVRESDALSRLERGEIGLEEYLDLRVSDAVSHLQNRLSADQLDFVKESLRAELQTDPVLIELVRRATGANIGA
jgi:hypothetical protein